VVENPIRANKSKLQHCITPTLLSPEFEDEDHDEYEDEGLPS